MVTDNARRTSVILFIAVMAALCAFAFTAADSSDAAWEHDHIMYDVDDDENLRVVGFKDDTKTYVIPQEITVDAGETVRVVQIDATLEGRDIDKITINCNCDIKEGTFKNLTSTAKEPTLIINNVTEIKQGAFDKCAFKKIYLDNTRIAGSAFKNMNDLAIAEFGSQCTFADKEEDTAFPFEGCGNLFCVYMHIQDKIADKQGTKFVRLYLLDEKIDIDAAKADEKFTFPCIKTFAGVWAPGDIKDGAQVDWDVVGETYQLESGLDKIEYTIKYNGNGGTGQMEDQKVQFDQFVNLTKNTFTMEGSHFMGWNTKQDGTGKTFMDEQRVGYLATRGEVTLYALWKENGQMVVFFQNCDDYCGIMLPQMFEPDVQQTLEHNLYSRHGYTFQGWATEQTGVKVYDDGETITVPLHNIVALYAVWEPISYIISFDKNLDQATGIMLPGIWIYDTSMRLGPNGYSANGFTFIGWQLSPTGDQVYVDKALVRNLTDVQSDKITLYAKWTEDPLYDVTFDVQGHGTAPDQQHVLKGDKVKEPEDPSADHFIFCGWFKDSGCNYRWNFDSDEAYGDMTLYAKWTADPLYAVTFDVQGHGTAPGQQHVREGDKVSEPEDPSADGFIFRGWFKDSGCNYRWNFDSDEAYGDMTLYAKWDESPKGSNAFLYIAIAAVAALLIGGQAYVFTARKPRYRNHSAGCT